MKVGQAHEMEMGVFLGICGALASPPACEADPQVEQVRLRGITPKGGESKWVIHLSSGPTRPGIP